MFLREAGEGGVVVAVSVVRVSEVSHFQYCFFDLQPVHDIRMRSHQFCAADGDDGGVEESEAVDQQSKLGRDS